MRNDIKFEDYSNNVKMAIQREVWNALEEASGELESQVKRNTKVKTGKTKSSWTHKVDKVNDVAYVGSNYDNAIWEEFGTGIYAQNGDGRKDVPWKYKTPDGKWYRTSGKKPRRALQNAFNSMKNTIETYFKERFSKL